MSIHVRNATDEDVQSIAVLFDQYRVFYKQSSDLSAATKFIQERITNHESVIFIAEENDTLIGFTQLYPIFSSVGMKRAWLLNDLFVIPTARGKGVADALLQAAQQWGKATQSRWLMLQTARDNFPAQKVYERNGWKRDEAFYVYNFMLDE
jgi:GNAT superfamily N-acetyltransferase